MADHLPCLCFSNSTCSDEECENTTKYELARALIIQQTKCKVHIEWVRVNSLCDLVGPSLSFSLFNHRCYGVRYRAVVQVITGLNSDQCIVFFTFLLFGWNPLHLVWRSHLIWCVLPSHQIIGGLHTFDVAARPLTLSLFSKTASDEERENRTEYKLARARKIQQNRDVPNQQEMVCYCSN